MNDRMVDIFQDNTRHGEDAYLVRELGPGTALDCVFDGVTHCEGAYASGFTKDLLAKGAIESLDDAVVFLKQANDILFNAGRGREPADHRSCGVLSARTRQRSQCRRQRGVSR